jgi:glutamyl-tRNA reductase
MNIKAEYTSFIVEYFIMSLPLGLAYRLPILRCERVSVAGCRLHIRGFALYPFCVSRSRVMNLVVVGISHKSAPLELRERFALSAQAVPEALSRLQNEQEIEEAVILSTCNRVEFVLVAFEKQDAMVGFRRFAESFYGIRFDEFAHCFHVHRDQEGVRHLCRVASGLDSLVVGEPQILGQVKQAYFVAKEAEACGNALEPVFHRVFNAAKRVRTETHVAEAPVSVSSAAVDLAEKALGGLQNKTAMIVGAGQMGELAARHLVSKGVSPVLVSNRTHAHAVALAQELRGMAIHFGEIWQGMRVADIIITSTGCPHVIITRQDMERLMAEREGRPILLIDIAVPRDVDPTVREVAGCTLVNIDGLEKVTHRNLCERQRAMEAADQILNEEMELFRERQEQLNVVPTIVSLRRRVEEIRQAEMKRMRRMFGELTPEQERALEALTHGLVNKILHTPFTEIKQAALRPDRSEFIDVVRTIFHLQEDTPASVSATVN